MKRHITKSEINQLPMQQYNGPVQLVRSAEDAERAVAELKNETLLGFDTETRPAFRRGEKYNPSLLQLAGSETVYLFQLKKTGLTAGIRAILSNDRTVKAGVSIRDDITELRTLAHFEPAGFVELAQTAKEAGIKNLGLRGMGALLLGFRISKKEQVSNWARNDLTPSQIRYAATDAWLGRELYLHLGRLT